MLSLFLVQSGAKDAIQWQMVNTVSNTSSLLGLLSQDQQQQQQQQQQGNNSDVIKTQPTTDQNTPHNVILNGTTTTAIVENHNYTGSGDVIRNIHHQNNNVMFDENGDVMDSGVFERTYFDDTLENEEDDYYTDNHADIEDFYGSKLSLLSSNDDDDDDEEETMMT